MKTQTLHPQNWPTWLNIILNYISFCIIAFFMGYGLHLLWELVK